MLYSSCIHLITLLLKIRVHRPLSNKVLYMPKDLVAYIYNNISNSCQSAGSKCCPANTKLLYNICTTSVKRLRRLTHIAQMLCKCFVIDGCISYSILALEVDHASLLFIAKYSIVPPLGERVAFTGPSPFAVQTSMIQTRDSRGTSHNLLSRTLSPGYLAI